MALDAAFERMMKVMIPKPRRKMGESSRKYNSYV